MTAEKIATALGGRRAGATWMARCPAHEDRAPSLSISARHDGKVLVRCHAGCDQRDVITALRNRGLWGRPEGFQTSTPAAAETEFPMNPISMQGSARKPQSRSGRRRCRSMELLPKFTFGHEGSILLPCPPCVFTPD
jgi:hypothetical protein